MPIREGEKFQEPDVCSSIELTVVGDGEQHREVVQFSVPKNTETLIVTFTDSGQSGYLRGPTGSQLVVSDPGNTSQANRVRLGKNGQNSYFIDSPQPGVWQFELSYQGRASAELNVAALAVGRQSRLAKLGSFARCKFCKVGLKAAVIALLVHLGPLVLAGIGASAAVAQLAATVGMVLSAVERALGVTHATLAVLSETLSEVIHDPIDNIMERACRVLNLCSAKA